MEKNIKYVTFLLLFISLIIIIMLIHSSNKKAENKVMDSIINSYSNYFIDAEKILDNENELEELKYKHFSNNQKNLGTSTVYRDRNITVTESYPFLYTQLTTTRTYKKTNFMEVFHDDEDLNNAKINFTFKEKEIILSSVFGRNDCQLFTKKMRNKNIADIIVNNNQVKIYSSIYEMCNMDYNIISVSKKYK